MLKAREPQLFAKFISELSNGLREIILANHGVFEKFTGDGVLAFFPDFYTGTDGGYYAITAAEECQRFFTQHYRQSYSCFESVLSLSDVGLGIGIDYGQISLERVGDEISIVGKPVVYACRMASTKAGTTLLNQRAYEKVNDRFSAVCAITEGELEVKHEARHVAYFVNRNNQTYTASEPAWKKFEKRSSPESVMPPVETRAQKG